LVWCGYIEVAQTSVLWLHRMACAMHCVSVYAHTMHSAHASHAILCSHNTDKVCTTSM
jgi:hypothetical protein